MWPGMYLFFAVSLSLGQTPGEERRKAGGDGKRTYPSIVRRILIRRSGPQPATAKTPMGGTVRLVLVFGIEGGGLSGYLEL